MKAYILLAVVVIMAGCKKNEAPVISSLECTPESRKAGTVFVLKVTASDKEGDLLTYQWNADEGDFLTTTNIREVQWKSPVNGAGKTFTISVTVSDGENEVTDELKILLEEPDLGTLEGHVYYTNFKIPIAGATVTVGDKSSLTDNDGYFVLTGTPAGECTLKATKQDFTFSQLILLVPVNGKLTVAIEITSINFTTKLSGIVTNPDGQPVGDARVVVLNPDGTESKLLTTTNSAGYYRLWYIPFGERTIAITKTETENIRFLESKTIFTCQDIEAQLNLTLQQLLLTGKFTDSRDNHIYQYKTIGNVTWMTENLAYLPTVSPSAQGSTLDAYYYVYGYQGTDKLAAGKTDNYKIYGVLYNWPATLNACPAGWHLPASDLEWDALLKPFGLQAAIKIKSKSGWADNGNGDNLSGFSAYPGGEVTTNGGFAGITTSTTFWTSSRSAGNSTCRGLNSINKSVYALRGSDRAGYSIRCVRNN